MSSCSGRKYHETTKHSWISVRQNPNRLDWNNQPSSLKFYPKEYRRIQLSKEFSAHNFIYHIGGITAKKSYPGVEYYLRTNPSAGALYPNELYFQARNVDGFDDGIYHFEVGSSSAVLLQNLSEDEGLEPLLHIDNPMNGLLFFISSPWYRSAWKYKNRAYRYCLLDAGHILGSIEAGSYLYEHAYRVAYNIDLKELNRFFNFGREEFFLSAAIVAIPKKGKTVKLPDSKIKQVDPAGVFEPNQIIEQAYSDTLDLQKCKKEPRFPKFTFHKQAWEETILKRRSIREFSGKSITKAQFEAIMEIIEQPVPSDCDEPLKVYAVLNRVVGMPIGIYHNGKLLKNGDFSKKAGYLCLEQRLGSDSAVTFFLLSDGCNYRSLYQKAGFIAHRIYLTANYLGIGCSGIGAYYDDEVSEFLGDESMVLYALAIGV
ncbi:nitroreductase family protein [Hydrogenimonas thermophila]|uniref:SagB-type dehydrogenase domain-containing protein n=1 Tax=Hydrogenimonas thermophila TaxID=223786 RepID=A0A1I5U9X8_9BACT|nr:nitroreductase family protein [Hydrogenimonas thermophila]SFP92028.1 SagB-type dehydrogenase domain-containing protein [Hydrogenimonas thermophila]